MSYVIQWMPCLSVNDVIACPMPLVGSPLVKLQWLLSLPHPSNAAVVTYVKHPHIESRTSSLGSLGSVDLVELVFR